LKHTGGLGEHGNPDLVLFSGGKILPHPVTGTPPIEGEGGMVGQRPHIFFILLKYLHRAHSPRGDFGVYSMRLERGTISIPLSFSLGIISRRDLMVDG